LPQRHLRELPSRRIVNEFHAEPALDFGENKQDRLVAAASTEEKAKPVLWNVKGIGPPEFFLNFIGHKFGNRKAPWIFSPISNCCPGAIFQLRLDVTALWDTPSTFQQACDEPA